MRLLLFSCLSFGFLFAVPLFGSEATPHQLQESDAGIESHQREDAAPVKASVDSSESSEEDDPGFLDRIKLALESFRFTEPVITNDAAIFGVLMVMLGIIFFASSAKEYSHWPIIAFVILIAAAIGFVVYIRGQSNPGVGTSVIADIGYFILPLALVAAMLSWAPLYRVVPMLLMCYFAPSLLTAFGWVDPEQSNLYFVATRYLLPASLVLLTISVDLREIVKLGPKAIIMFLTGTVGVIVGGPLAVFIVSMFSPEIVGGVAPAEIWKGLSTVAGSWIGGGANQAAMKEIFMPESMDPEANARINELYSVMVAVDVLVAEFWMIFLLLGVGKAKQIDKLFGADSSAVDRLQKKMEEFSISTARIPSSADFMVILAFGFGVTALCHVIGDWIAPWLGENFEWTKRFSLDSKFFWLIVLATAFGVLLSFTRIRNYEGAGASKIGTVCIFVLVATIGLKMDIIAIFEHPGLFLVGGIWMLFHVGLLIVVGYMIRAPYFFLAVGSKANIGGAASAPVIAAAFHPSLAPVGVLLAVLGYALGTYGAWLCAMLMRAVAP